jgi:hypothetical protein
MAIGLIVMKWDERVGSEILAEYPEEIIIEDKTLMQVYSTHEYSGETGMISLMVGSLNIASYYTGPENGYYFLLLLSLDDDPDAYEGGLIDVSRIVLQNIEDDNYLNLMPTLFQRLTVYPKLNYEQRLLITYQDEIKRLIINRLREEGLISKSELIIWLKDQYIQGFVDLEGVLIDLIKHEIIKETSVKGMPSELIFLINDFVMTRRPPVNLISNPCDKGLPSQLMNDYITECKKFFKEYRPSKVDSLKIIELLVNPQVYEVLRLLRTAIVTKNDLEKLKKKGVEDIDDVLKSLWENQMIQVFQDERGNEYYALLADFYIKLIFPKYIVNTIKTEYEKKSKADLALIEYLNILEATYLKIKKPAKILE